MLTIRQRQTTDRDEWLRLRDALWPDSFGDLVREIEAYFYQPKPHTAVSEKLVRTQ